jgi:hypothetical protein
MTLIKKENKAHFGKNCRIMSFVERLDGTGMEPYQAATISHIGSSELSIETDRKLKPGERIRIHLGQLVPEELTNHFQLNNSKGVIRWSKSMKQGKHRIFEIGIDLQKESGNA